MSDPATNENLRTGRGVRPSAGEQQGGTVKKGQTEPHVDKQSGWQTKTFGEVLEIRNGRNQREVESDDGEFPIYGSAGNVMGMATDHICEAGTTIIGRKGNINSPIYADTRFWNVDTAFGLAAKAGMDSRFLYFFCLSYDFSAHNRGTTIPSLVKSELLNIPIPVPPLAEQQRIVGLLDEAFEGLATAKANAEKNLQNARALFESHLQSVFTQRGPGWVDRQLDSLCHEITVGHVGSMKTEYKASGIPFLRSQNIRPFEVSMENAMFIDEAFHRALKKSQLRPGDLAIVRTGYPGTAAVIPPELPDSNCSDLVIVRPSKEVNPHFLAAFFNSAFGKQLVLGKIVGAAQKHFNITAAKEVMLHVPPIPEQRTIIAMVDDLREQTHHLARLYEQKLAALEALKKSLLHQAFTGEL